jgi:hypothetical protein
MSAQLQGLANLPSESTEEEDWWAPQPAWTLWRRGGEEKTSTLARKYIEIDQLEDSRQIILCALSLAISERGRQETNWLNNGQHISVSTKLMLISKFIVRQFLRKAKVHPVHRIMTPWILCQNMQQQHLYQLSVKIKFGQIGQVSLSLTQQPHICCRENFA